MKLSPTHRISVNLLVKGTQAVLNHTCHVSLPDKAPEEIANTVRMMYGTARPPEMTAEQTRFLGLTTSAGTLQVAPERFELLSVEVIDIFRFTDVQAAVVFQEQVILPTKVQTLQAQAPNLFIPGRSRN